ncbi:helix-turn-helix transcriptional regulator [Mycobacterium colombiense]|uniref:helix-turn-helix transcriptional regulator n=1 Tax=Mycobacterium colombiense TaxID=339268 RepID=UPI000B1E3305
MLTASDVVLMSTTEVSAELGIPVGTLRYYRSSGRGPASFRLGGRIRYRRADVMAWVDDQERNSRRGQGVA